MTHRAGLLFAVELMGRIVVERREPRIGQPKCGIFHAGRNGCGCILNPGPSFVRIQGISMHCDHAPMPALNDLALTVEEREPGQFYWTLLEALDNSGHSDVHDVHDAHDTLEYRVFRSATKPQATYSNALALGVAELQKISASPPSVQQQGQG
jgi:hypothetical protein